MFKVTHLAGVDPGIVHTGVVLLTIDKDQRCVVVDHEAVPGSDVTRVQQFLGGLRNTAHVFIEGYKPRSVYDTDARMAKAVNEIKAGLPTATVLLNTGVKKVVKQPLMELLGCWKFSTPTHHQDLRSAARIALLGALKQEHTNRLIADIVRDHLRGDDWNVTAA